MTDGNRRIMSTVGLINQRYNISLIGNHQKIEVVSKRQIQTQCALLKTQTWYRLKTQVDVHQMARAPSGQKLGSAARMSQLTGLSKQSTTRFIKTAPQDFSPSLPKSEAGLHRQPKGNPRN